MNSTEPAVSLHPYFRINPGQMEAAKALLREFVAKTAVEEKVISYEFTVNGDEVFCREAYLDADGVLAHLDNVGALLERLLTMASLIRLEVHGPAEELGKLKGPLGPLQPAWFVHECGVKR
jgi:quinol monooxygenase YgiN